MQMILSPHIFFFFLYFRLHMHSTNTFLSTLEEKYNQGYQTLCFAKNICSLKHFEGKLIVIIAHQEAGLLKM